MGHGHELDVERPERETAAERHDVHRDLRRVALALALGFEQGGGERRRVDRQLEPRPQVEQSAEMFLVRVREHDAEKVAALLHQIADIRHDEIDAGERVVGEGDAEIDRDPLPALFVAKAVDREIHADLADPAERGEHELIGGASHHRFPITPRCRIAAASA